MHSGREPEIKSIFSGTHLHAIFLPSMTGERNRSESPVNDLFRCWRSVEFVEKGAAAVEGARRGAF